MTLEQKVMAALKTAMLAKDQVALRSLRAIKSAILNAKTAEGYSGEITEEEELKLLHKMVKQRKDSLEIYEVQNREELAEKEREEITVIEKFLPRQLDEKELTEILSGIIEQSGASAPSDMGKVMGLANKQLTGMADGKTVARIVRDLLAKG